MSLRTMFQSSESRRLEGTPTEIDARRRSADLADVRAARIAAARSSSLWTEYAETDLVERSPYVVSAETDAYFLRYRGDAFSPATADVIADRQRLAYVVTDSGELRLYEPQPGTWSQRVDRLAARELRRNAPRARPAWMRD